MIASNIKVGEEYAVSDSPRKGQSDLYDIAAIRVKVLNKNVNRWADNACEGAGAWKPDGVEVVRLGYNNGEAMGSQQIFKARDFLMPFDQYKEERDRRAENQRVKAAEIAAREKALTDRHEAVMNGFESMGLVRYVNASTPWDFRDSGGHDTEFSVSGAEKLMTAIAERIYEAVKNAT